ncbi:MAG: TusE/DsrC/DsvC family sulfur relay protein [Acidobacteria bacterium]|nr:TusE/DsrC/DsvC family sulfur relay protein [Acidobacteriota bacterium]
MDADGCLASPREWHEEVARTLARGDRLELTEPHWTVIWTAMRPQTRILYSFAGPHSGPLGARSAPNRYWQPAKGLRGDIKGRSPLAGSRFMRI